MASGRAGKDSGADAFEKARPRLWGLAYRMLGSAADADDAVQDTWLRWQKAKREEIASPEAWLTTACSRRCIDMARASHRSRTDYFGPWLPEPLVGSSEAEAEREADMAASLSTAFLLMLERLSPVERAAYLLHDVFDYGYADIAAALDRKEDACRKLVSRARARLKGAEPRFDPEPALHQRLLDSFLDAARSGDLQRLESMLTADAEMWADGGGKVPARPDVLHGAATVAKFITMVGRKWWGDFEIEPASVNGVPGLVMRKNGALEQVLSISLDGKGRIAGVYVVRNPDKLARVATMQGTVTGE